MSLEENEAIIRRWIEVVWNQANIESVDEFVTDTYVRHDPNIPEVRGPEEEKQHVARSLSAFPDLRFTIEDMVAEGEKVVVRLTGRGTHKGELLGLPPTDKQITLATIEIYRLAEGKIDEQWVIMDVFGVMQQLGAFSQPGQEGAESSY